MKPWMKWSLLALLAALVLAGALRTLVARKEKQTALQAQQTAQKSQVSVRLAATDVVPVKLLELTQSVAISGPIRALNSAFVKARVPGELQRLSVREGDWVKAGQEIAQVDPSESQARWQQASQQAQAAKAQVDIAQRSFANNQALVAQGFISSTALEATQATLSAAQANYAAAQAGVALARKALNDAVLYAPIAGQIAQRLAQSGERVAVEARIVEIVDNRQLELAASLTAADALQVKLGQQAQLEIDGVSAPVSAKVVRINPSASTASRAVLVYLAVAPGLALRHGMFAHGTLATGSMQALALPLSALRTDRPQPYVQLLRQGQVQQQNVRLGARSEMHGQTLVAVSDLAEGTQVLNATVGSLRPGTPVQIDATSQGKP